jgi:TolB-like protein/Flp pilus assembly protein TadD
MKGFFGELSRRNVVRMGALYLVGSWLLLQVADVLFGALTLPEWTLRLVLGMLIIGFPVVLVFAWVYEMTPEGLKRESEVDRSQSVTPYTGKKLNGAIIGVLAVALVFSVAQRYWSGPGVTPTAPAQEQTAGETEVSAQAQQMPSVAAIADQDMPSIAVLPFVNMSDDPENEYFSDGLSEELLNVLAQVPGLRVAARTSACQFKGQSGDVAEIAKQLRVGTVLEGSVRRAGDRVRITAQLIKAADGYHLWSKTFDKQLLDVFAIQDEIAEKVVEALRITLLGDTQQELTAGRTEDFEAYNQYLMARQLQAQGSYGSLARAVELYQQVLARDPDYRDAQAALLETYLYQAGTGQISNAELQSKAVPVLEQVLRLDSERGIRRGDVLEFQVGLAMSQAFSNVDSRRDRDERARRQESELEQAIVLSPNNVRALMRLSGFRRFAGDMQGATKLLERARQLDPLALDVRRAFVNLYMESREYDKALAEARRMQELSPGAPTGYWSEARIEQDRGDFYRAMRATEKARQIDPDDHEMPSALAWIYLAMGDTERAAPLVEQAIAMAPQAPSTYVSRMRLAMAREQEAEALAFAREVLDKGIENRSGAQFWAGYLVAADAWRRKDYPVLLDWFKTVNPTSFRETITYERMGDVYIALHWTLPSLQRAGENARATAVLEAARQFVAGYKFQPYQHWDKVRLESLLRWLDGGGDAALAGYAQAMQAEPLDEGWWQVLQNPFMHEFVVAAPIAAELKRVGERTRAMGERLRQEDGYVSARAQARR